MASILVIEDGLVHALDLQELLHRHGHTVCGMRREHALCFAAKWRPDLVIMDAALRGWFDEMTAADRTASQFRCGLITLETASAAARTRPATASH